MYNFVHFQTAKIVHIHFNIYRQSIKLQAFINEIKATDTLNLKFNDKLFNLTIINIKVYKDSHLEFNFKDGSAINIEL